MSDGRWNRHLGWALLLSGFLQAVWLDPWSLSEHDPKSLVGSPRMAARHAQAVLFGMAFLQLMVGRILAGGTWPPATRWIVSGLSAVGALVYAAGYLLLIRGPEGVWLSALGGLLNFLAFAVLALDPTGLKGKAILRVVLVVFCAGMLLDAAMGLFAASPGWFRPTYLGPDDGVRLRMLRLARAAAIALSLLTLLYQDLAARLDRPRRLLHWAGLALLVGAVGMPLTLMAAAFLWLDLKYLLGIPAQATFLGTLAGLWLAGTVARPLEAWGWAMIAVGMAAGLLMGLYAFDGPVPAPDFLGAYNDFPRRLSRLGHAYCIVLGLLSLFLSRERAARANGWLARVGAALLVAGSVTTLAVLAVVARAGGPLRLMSLGPALVVGGLSACLATTFLPKKEAKPP